MIITQETVYALRILRKLSGGKQVKIKKSMKMNFCLSSLSIKSSSGSTVLAL